MPLRLAAVLLALVLPQSVLGQFGCRHGPPRTIRVEAAESTLVFHGRLTNPQRGPDDGSTDVVIEEVLKGGGFGPGDTLRIHRFIAVPNPKDPPRGVFFVDIHRGVPDIYRMLDGTRALRDYAKGVLAAAPRGHVAVLHHSADYLGHEDREIAADAYNEFRLADDADVRRVARQLRPAKLRRWIQDTRTGDYRIGLFAYLLGNCGEAQDAVLLRRLLDRKLRAETSGLDRVLVGYTLLRPRAGAAHILDLASNPDICFLLRYSALRAARVFWSDHRDVVKESDLLAIIRQLLRQSDIADLAIEDLRKWRCWRLTDEILPMFEDNAINIPIVRRTILRYALSCPDPQGRRLVDKVRKSDPEMVKENEELLKLEVVN